MEGIPEDDEEAPKDRPRERSDEDDEDEDKDLGPRPEEVGFNLQKIMVAFVKR